MKDKSKYLFVGTFVIIGAILIIGIWLWFSQSSRQAFDTYVTIFHESVDGVSTNSVIKYNGVEVGRVKAITLDRQNPNNIYIVLAINQGMLITTQTYASVKSQGVTGMSYISLQLDKKQSGQIIAAHNSEPYPQIPSRQSFLSSLTEQAQGIANNVGNVTTQIKSALNESNIEHLNNIMANLDKVSEAVASKTGDISSVVSEVSQVLNNVNKNTKSLDVAIVELSNLSKALQQNSKDFSGFINAVQTDTLQNVNTVLLPNLNQTVSNINKSTSELDQLLATLNQNPSVLIRGKAPAHKGPGE